MGSYVAGPEFRSSTQTNLARVQSCRHASPLGSPEHTAAGRGRGSRCSWNHAKPDTHTRPTGPLQGTHSAQQGSRCLGHRGRRPRLCRRRRRTPHPPSVLAGRLSGRASAVILPDSSPRGHSERGARLLSNRSAPGSDAAACRPGWSSSDAALPGSPAPLSCCASDAPLRDARWEPPPVAAASVEPSPISLARDVEVTAASAADTDAASLGAVTAPSPA